MNIAAYSLTVSNMVLGHLSPIQKYLNWPFFREGGTLGLSNDQVIYHTFAVQSDGLKTPY